MTILPLDPAANATPAALLAYLEECRMLARKSGRPRLASISVEVAALDPLAVLESIFERGERHFYAERRSEGCAVAGAEAVASFEASGPGRFQACARFVDALFADAVVVGDQSAPFAGPHAFAAFTFEDEAPVGAPFAAASVFIPRWQVACRDGRTVAVANVLVGPDSPTEALAGRVWRAHAKFRAFEYGGAAPAGAPLPEPGVRAPDPLPIRVGEVGSGGGYLESVARALERIGRGEFEKIVLARAKDLGADADLHPLLLLNGLRDRFGECHAFSVANGRGQSFIGATPERLARVEGGVLMTEALAGSVRRGTSASEDAALGAGLLGNGKDLREQRIVLDWILSQLGPLGLEPSYPPRPGLRRLANVQHLHTPVTARLPEGIRLLDVVERLHPTPAVGGHPRDAAVAAIRTLEPFDRGLYAGVLGWIDARGGGEFLVGLRSALVDGPNARLFSGAGIVAGSSPQAELDETELKFRALQEAFLAGGPGR